MSSQIQALLFRLSDPRKVALLLNLLFLALALAGCGGLADDCPTGGAGAGCGGG